MEKEAQEEKAEQEVTVSLLSMPQYILCYTVIVFGGILVLYYNLVTNILSYILLFLVHTVSCSVYVLCHVLSFLCHSVISNVSHKGTDSTMCDYCILFVITVFCDSYILYVFCVLRLLSSIQNHWQ